MIIGQGGASGLGWSELKDIECPRRYSYVVQQRAENEGKPRVPTKHDEAFQCGSYMHAARAKWLELDQKTGREIAERCFQAGREECVVQGYECSEYKAIEYALLFTNYMNFWGRMPLLKPFATEYYVEYDFWEACNDNHVKGVDYKRSTRYDDICFYPDVAGHCIGEFKTTHDLSGALKFYTEHNPQIMLQQLIYIRSKAKDPIAYDSATPLPEIKGTMVDIWDKIKLKGTRHFIPLNEDRLEQFEQWLIGTLERRAFVIDGGLNHRNFMVCNTYNDAFKSQCAFKERCLNDCE